MNPTFRILALILLFIPTLLPAQPEAERQRQRARDAYYYNNPQRGPSAEEQADADLAGSAIGAIGRIWLNEIDKSRTRIECTSGSCNFGQGTQVKTEAQVKYRYMGNFRKGKFDGKGTMAYLNGGRWVTLYEGEYRNGVPHGKGKSYDFGVHVRRNSMVVIGSVNMNGWSYEGYFVNGQYSGFGTRYNPQGQKTYEGQWRGGKRHGKGKLFHTNGQVSYTGDWSDGELSGNGKTYYDNGQLQYEGRFEDGFFTGPAKIYDKKGKLGFEGHLGGLGKEGNGTQYLDNGERFVGEWNLRQRKYRHITVDGRVEDSEGNQIRKVRVRDQYDLIGYYNRGIFLVDVGLMGAMEGKTRFPGTSRLMPASQGLLPNYELRVSLLGPRVLTWNRIRPHFFINSRAYYFPEATGDLFLHGSVFPPESNLGAEFRQIAARGGEEQDEEPIYLSSREIGAGLSAYIPFGENASVEVGGGVVLNQRALLKFNDIPLQDGSAAVPDRRIRNVLMFPQRDWYIDTGFRFAALRICMRTYYRKATMMSENYPLYTFDGTNYTPLDLSNPKGRLHAQLNIALQVPLGWIPRQVDRYRDILPFTPPKE